MNLRCIGQSRDLRTNRWSVTCTCGKTWEPRTTMYRWQTVTCPGCAKEFWVDYNEQIIKEVK